MPKPYQCREQKRRWQASLSLAMKQYAESTRCPKCKRKMAYHAKDKDFTVREYGFVRRECRYCGYWTQHNLADGKYFEGFGNTPN